MKFTSWWRVEGGSYSPVRGLKYEPDRNRTNGLTLCIWELYPRFEIGINRDRLYPRFEIWADRNRWMVSDRCTPLEFNSMHESSRSRESSVFVCESMYVWCGWIMKAWLFCCFVWDRNPIYENIYFLKTL